METEEWRDVADFPMYSVSNFGFIRNKKTGRILKFSVRKKYCSVTLMTRVGDVSTAEKLSVHRIVAKAFIPNPEPVTKPKADHIDRNPSNNRVDNLRWASDTENARNKSIMKNNTSGITGVYLHKPTGRWMSYIRNNGKMEYLGLYDTKEEAEFIRVGAAADYFGDFAVANNTTGGAGISLGGTTTVSFD